MYTWSVCNLLKCFSSRIGENLEQSLPSLTELILTSNNIQELVSAWSHLNVWIKSVNASLMIYIEIPGKIIIVLVTCRVTWIHWPRWRHWPSSGMNPQSSKLVIDLSGAPPNSDPARLQSLNLQLVKESSDEQEALQALCHQQTPTDPCAWLPEGETQG